MLKNSNLDLNRPSSQGQWNLIEKLAVESGHLTPQEAAQNRSELAGLTFGKANELIGKLKAMKAGRGNQTPASEDQLAYLNRLILITKTEVGTEGLTHAEADQKIKRLATIRKNLDAEVRAKTDAHLARVEKREEELAQYPEAPTPAIVMGAMDLIEADEELARLLA
ncbi:hypothetical protein [Rathayibacter sp. SD072]|uniref:hypothetical protein n=1 Tax=Rathayibacter sp. SD072 TaxID=2781731 RepID=UPI001A9659E0|nr:hypothetical protein [Rathayibacter sp. SD072]MBO0983924.1 hypothetical protein [Rathayibacter sp. SD072]